ncbi:helix-turn-helix domain-containing protein [Candidatus Palauibacter sp.]
MLLRKLTWTKDSVTEISRELGISRQTIYRWISGARRT